MQGQSVSALLCSNDPGTLAGAINFTVPTPGSSTSQLQQDWPLNFCATPQVAVTPLSPPRQLTPDEMINRLESILLSPSAMHLSDLLQNMETAPLDVHFPEPEASTVTPGVQKLPSITGTPGSHSISFPQLSHDGASPSFGVTQRNSTPGMASAQSAGASNTPAVVHATPPDRGAASATQAQGACSPLSPAGVALQGICQLAGALGHSTQEPVSLQPGPSPACSPLPSNVGDISQLSGEVSALPAKSLLNIFRRKFTMVR
jgi:hypothetical protein